MNIISTKLTNINYVHTPICNGRCEANPTDLTGASEI